MQTPKPTTAFPPPAAVETSTKEQKALKLSNLLVQGKTVSNGYLAYLAGAINGMTGVKGLDFIYESADKLDSEARYLLMLSLLRVSVILQNAPERERERLALSVAATTKTVYDFAPESDGDFFRDDEYIVDVAQSAMLSASSQGYRCDAAAIRGSSAVLNLLALEQVIVGERSPVAPLSRLLGDAPWFDGNLHLLVPYAQPLRERKTVSRDFCESLVSSGTAPALSDGFL